MSVSPDNMTFVNFTFTGAEGPDATMRLLSVSPAELELLGATNLSVSYVSSIPTSTVAPSTTQPAAAGDDGGLSDQDLILAIVLPIVGVMMIAAVVYYCLVVRHSSGDLDAGGGLGGHRNGSSRSFAFGTRKEEIRFDEYLAIIDGPTEMMNLEERML